MSTDANSSEDPTLSTAAPSSARKASSAGMPLDGGSSRGMSIPHNESREEISYGARRESDEREDHHDTTPRKKSAPMARKLKKSQQHGGRFYPSMQPPQGHFSSGGIPRGPYHGPPYPYAGGSTPFPPPPHYHPHHPPHPQMPPMPPFNAGGPPPYSTMSNHQRVGGSGAPGPYSSHYGNRHPYPSMAPAPYSSHGMPPYPPMTTSDSASISSKGSKSSKKRTIDGVHESFPPVAHATYTFRRTDSNSSSTSTVTAGNNTSIETHATDERENRHDSQHPGDMSAMGMGPMGYDDHDHGDNRGGSRARYHRRDYSADASTTSSLSAGFSLASYEGPKDTAPIRKSSPKRIKGGDGEPLLVDTNLRPASANSHDADHSTRFEQLSIGAKAEPNSTKSDSSDESRTRNLFLSLSTSPINASADVDATPISKNTKVSSHHDKSKSSIFKKKGDSIVPKLEVSTSDIARPSETPTPPVHGDLEDSEMMSDDHNTLNRHLRGQSFTPINHASNGGEQSNTHGDNQFTIAPQLSWSIAGDTPSLGDLAEWDEDKSKVPNEQKIRPSSTTSNDSRNMMISPHDFHLWKEEHELVDQAIGGATTPLPAFFESRGQEGTENHMNYETSNKRHTVEDTRPTYMTTTSRHPTGYRPAGKPVPHQAWSKHEHMHHGMPPTPMYSSTEYREDPFAARSPYGDDRRDRIDGSFPFYAHPGGMHSTDRVRNLRGRMPPTAHFPPMLHIPPPMSAQLPMTSPMALPSKAGLWSPHGGLPPLSSPHHLTSPINSLSQTKRKCVPLKPPIPAKFQGDPEKVKNIPVPEFTSLVNFPSHMSQKQSVNLPEGMRCCVMCGQACPCSNGGKSKNKKKAGEGLVQRGSNGQDHVGEKGSGYAQIPTQNKGLCTLCDVNVWVVVATGLEIKWCKGCKNFRPWAAFGDKGLATKCLRCRERQREKYALQKEEKERARGIKTKS